MFVSLYSMLQNWEGGHVGVGVGAYLWLVLWGGVFVLECSDMVGSLQLESHYPWPAGACVPFEPMCFNSPSLWSMWHIPLLKPFPFPFPKWHMMTPFLLQLFRRPSRINTQESCKEIWIWRKKKKKKKTKQKNKLKTHPCQTFWHKGATVTTC